MNLKLSSLERTRRSLATAVVAALAFSSSLHAETLPEWAQMFYSEQFNSEFASVPAENHDLWALLIIDTNAAQADALGIPKDGEAMSSFLKSVFASKIGIGRQLHLRILQNDNVKESTIANALTEFAVKPEDALFVYYSGHGGYDLSFLEQVKINKSKIVQNEVLSPKGGPVVRWKLKINDSDISPKYDNDAGHFLATSNGPIFRWRLKNAMEAKNAQLNILITDCCANYGTVEEGKAAKLARVTIGGQPRRPPVDFEAKMETVPIQEDLVRDLLFRTVGWVSVQACDIGDTTAGTRTGGLFSQLFLQRIANPNAINNGIRIRNDIDWQTITYFVTQGGTVIDPTLSRAEIDELLANQKRDKWTHCFAAGINRAGVKYRIEQSANRPPDRIAKDFKAVKKVTISKTIRGEFDGGLAASFQKGRILHANEKVDPSKPWCELAWERRGLPDEHNKIVIKAGQSYAAKGNGYVSTLRRGHTYTLLELTAMSPDQRRFLGSEIVANYRLFIHAPGTRDPSVADIRECCGDYIELFLH